MPAYEIWKSEDLSELSLFQSDNPVRDYLTRGLVHVETFEAVDWEEAKERYEKVLATELP